MIKITVKNKEFNIDNPKLLSRFKSELDSLGYEYEETFIETDSSIGDIMQKLHGLKPDD